jgi:hypothetical protein
MTTDEIGRRRRRKPGDIAALRRTLWAGLLEIEDLLATDDPTVKIKAGHCLATLAGTYLKALELTDIVARLDKLEAAQGAATITPMRRVS